MFRPRRFVQSMGSVFWVRFFCFNWLLFFLFLNIIVSLSWSSCPVISLSSIFLTFVYISQYRPLHLIYRNILIPFLILINIIILNIIICLLLNTIMLHLVLFHFIFRIIIFIPILLNINFLINTYFSIVIPRIIFCTS